MVHGSQYMKIHNEKNGKKHALLKHTKFLKCGILAITDISSNIPQDAQKVESIHSGFHEELEAHTPDHRWLIRTTVIR
ncbi:hypothetical protein CEXT_354371 [Caerostris extrusa]|uniref:Uncharacterized protein n=1 Tax=Caerostris extrusa TaxID=172846 RepID=A0AAV4Y4S5_CAEEX|nr:hypothetical protein CEXT_354371 [Caerostris extrusa]